MSVSLKKGQKVNLSKEDVGLTKIIAALGWDEATAGQSGGKKGFWASLFAPFLNAIPIDCDASAILLKDGRLTARKDVVYFGNLRHRSNAVQHMGDNLTGAGDGDNEMIVIQLDKVPDEYDKIVFVVNIFQAKMRQQHFGMVRNAFIRLINASNNREICRYNLSEDYSGMTAMIFGEVYRQDGEWRFNAIGQGTNDDSLTELSRRFE